MNGIAVTTWTGERPRVLLFCFVTRQVQVRVRTRIWKLSKASSATCIQA